MLYFGLFVLQLYTVLVKIYVEYSLFRLLDALL